MKKIKTGALLPSNPSITADTDKPTITKQMIQALMKSIKVKHHKNK